LKGEMDLVHRRPERERSHSIWGGERGKEKKFKHFEEIKKVTLPSFISDQGGDKRKKKT